MKLENFIAFKLQCKECDFCVESGEIPVIESLVSVSDHIEAVGHIKYELEIYDFDLIFIREARDIVKLFEDIDSLLSIQNIASRLKDFGYENTGPTIRGAIQNDILYIDDIDNDNNDVFLALTELGKDLWSDLNASGHRAKDIDRSLRTAK